MVKGNDKLKRIMKHVSRMVKKMIKIVFITLSIVSLVGFLTVPFLHSVMQLTMAQWIWYPCAIFFLTASIIDSLKNKVPMFKNPEIEFLGKWGFFCVFPIATSIFVFNYYDIDTIWLWVIFAIIAISVPLFFFILFAVHFKNNQVEDVGRQKMVGNMIKSIFLYWFLDLLYLSIFNGWLIPTFVFGILSLVIISFNLADAFLHGTSMLRFFIALELVLGLALCGYLIYIIPNVVIQNIVLTISAALIGGIFTLLGVAWTIKKGDADRRDDLRRIEEERKAEERKKYIPYLRLSFDKEMAPLVVNASITKVLDLNDKEDRLSLDGNTFYSITIENFIVKNISHSNIILNGVVLHGKYYPFSHTEIIEPGMLCQIRTTNNWSVSVSKPQSSISLIATDMLENKYEIICQVTYNFNSNLLGVQVNLDDEDFTGIQYSYKITSLELPMLIDEEGNH